MPAHTSAPAFTPRHFWEACERNRETLLARARPMIGPAEREDCVQDALLQAYRCLDRYHHNNDEGFVAWISEFLRHVCQQMRRQLKQARQARLYDNLTDPDDLLTEEELRAEVRFRLCYAEECLTEPQKACVRAHLRGEQQVITARVLGISQQHVSNLWRQALAKMRECPASALHAPDIDRYAFRLGSRVSIYHAPTTTGAALAREHLRGLR